MDHAISTEEVPISFLRKFQEYGIDIKDGGTSILQIANCPWCGVTLPKSLRNEWFDRLEALGIDPYGEGVPSQFLDERWYSQA
jgi:hypothetical protein